jgi:peptide/nickel transport system ATP-binding protein/oligopeptide transport system ATP-binding protein
MTESAHSEASTTVLDVRNLKTYFFMEKSTVRAVDGVSLKLERNKTLGLVGESGCGKSVTALSIMRLIQSPPGEIVEGEILLHRNGKGGEVDIATLDPRGRRMRKIRGEEIAMVFQEPMTSLNPLYTVGEQIAETVRLHQNVGREEAMDRALDMLHQVRISDPEQRLREYPHQLSGGMRQRVMIAMALSCNPAILIADEPTTALDVTVQAQILDLMRELQDEFGSGIIMITHNLGVISQIADDVAVMYLGKIVEYADVRTVFHNPHHPYTVGLLNSVPVFGRGGEKVLVPIEGMVPTPTEEIRGCAFAPRCPRAKRVCTEREPPLREVEPGHYAACWPE